MPALYRHPGAPASPNVTVQFQVLCWNGERWGASGPFGIATMALDCAFDYIANESDFWIHD
ncbi:hypothetical protein CHT98_17195 (plasmid) [Azospirillum brasilense]|uniref:Uncharacterized protein n=1 Tax=Azospirillum brasilense TaxID=192 RepID=A0A235HD09_AZOBR|nr:hypothetical protein CHT98_17195 [Azospirillum brasilense]